MLNPFLIGTKIYLAPLSTADVSAAYVGWLNDPEVCRYNSHARFAYNEAKALEYVEQVQRSRSDFAFAIRMKDSDCHVGNVSLQSVDWVNRSGELAILIGERAAWGAGIGYECYQLLIAYAFKTLNLNRVYSGQTSSNAAMIRICEKVGMRREGILRQSLFKNGRYENLETFAIIRSDCDG